MDRVMSTLRPYPPGEIIPGTVYRVVHHIASGGMGCVYDVYDTSIAKRYVLKTLHVELSGRADLATRMAKEARVLAQLAHPNIVEVVTAGVTGDELRLPFFVMERLRGESLREVLANRRGLALEASLGIAIDLLDALDHAHGQNVVHRDVKPDNIFLERATSGVVVTKLIDFGVMKIMGGGSRLTAGCFVGTMRYAAPEQLLGKDVTPKSDLYSAALVLYEMLAARGPFDGEATEHAVAEARLLKTAPSLSCWVSIPKSLDDVICAALAADPAQRPADAFTFASRLRAHLRAIDRDGNATQRTTVEALLPVVDVRARDATDGGATLLSTLSPAVNDDATEVTPPWDERTQRDPDGILRGRASSPPPEHDFRRSAARRLGMIALAVATGFSLAVILFALVTRGPRAIERRTRARVARAAAAAPRSCSTTLADAVVCDESEASRPPPRAASAPTYIASAVRPAARSAAAPAPRALPPRAPLQSDGRDWLERP